MSPVISAAARLLCSNVFMTSAWYGHPLAARPWYVAALVSWGIAWAALCLHGAVYFLFRSPGTT